MTTHNEFDKACKDNDIEKGYFILNNRTEDISYYPFGAISYDKIELLKHCINLGANQIDEHLNFSCLYGQLELVKYLISIGANNMATALKWACSGGHMPVVKFLIEKDNSINMSAINDALSAACISNQLKVAKYLVEECKASDFNNALYKTCDLLHFDKSNMCIIAYLVNCGATNHEVIHPGNISTLLNWGCHITGKLANKLRHKRKKKILKVKQILYDFKMYMYDVNIGDIIGDYAIVY